MARLVAVRVLVEGLPPKTLLNVNVPAGAPRGLRVTRLGHRVYSDKIVEQTDPRGRTHYWIGGGDPRVGGARGHRHGGRARGLRLGHARCTWTSRAIGAWLEMRGLVGHAERAAPAQTESDDGSPCRRSRAPFERERERMVEEQLVARGITDPRVLDAMRRVPRHLFVEEALRDRAYGDHPLPIGEEQTISQPYIVGPDDLAAGARGHREGARGRHGLRLPDRGARRAGAPRLLHRAAAAASPRGRARCSRASASTNVWIRVGNGTLGWPDEAPFDRILVTAGGPGVPAAALPAARRGRPAGAPAGRLPTNQTLTLVENVGGDDAARRPRRLQVRASSSASMRGTP